MPVNGYILRRNPPPNKGESIVLNIFAEIQKHISCEAKARSFRLSSSHVEEQHPIVQRAVAMGRVPFGSPTLSDQAQIGRAHV